MMTVNEIERNLAPTFGPKLCTVGSTPSIQPLTRVALYVPIVIEKSMRT